MATHWIRKSTPLVWILLFSLSTVGTTKAEEQSIAPDSLQFFESKIRPVLVEHCYRCHSAEGQGVRGGLAVDSRDALLAGGESGPAIVAGNLEDSILWNAINYRDYKMPPKNRLPKEVIEDFRKWIEMGAPDPRVQSGVVVHSKVTTEDIQKGKQFWAFRPAVDQSPSDSQNALWAKSTIDKYVASGWDKSALTPADDADGIVMIRRIYYDLIGLPPQIEEIDRFQKLWNESPDQAISTTIDDLLERPQFGERWGRYWLDTARYAESSGKEVDMTFPHAWRYRNYVIDSFNNDKPYDQFIREQIAGDLLSAKTDKEFAEHLIATGFLAIGPKALIEQNPRQFQADLVDEQIDTTTRVILGVSVACARCHDHKFDPIPQTDYYALAGIFQSTETFYGGIRSIRNRQPSNLIILPTDDPNPNVTPISKSEMASLREQVAQREKEYIEARRAQRMPSSNKEKPGERPSFINVAILDQAVALLQNKINSVDEDGKPLTFCMGVQDSGKPKNAKVLVRGEIDQPAQEVERGFVQVLSSEPAKFKSGSSGRRELAQWLSSSENPLTARVMVNRIWQHLMGKAIVSEVDNFGASGPGPTHPELLDHLAVQFMENGWSVKQSIRAIMNSRVYRLSSVHDNNRFQVDPDNQYLSRANVRRLDAEAIRDSLLAISNQIDLKRPKASLIASFGTTIVGPNGPIAIPPELASMNASKDSTANSVVRSLIQRGRRNPNNNPIEVASYTRSVYMPIIRNSLPRALDVFDFAEPSLVVGARETSNTADQSLYLLNNPFVLEQSDAIARRVIRMASSNPERVATAFRLVYGRPATKEEIKAASKFFRESENDLQNRAMDEKLFQQFSLFCQALVCSAEFRFIN